MGELLSRLIRCDSVRSLWAVMDSEMEIAKESSVHVKSKLQKYPNESEHGMESQTQK